MRAILDGVVCKERTDLDPGFSTIPGFAIPENASRTAPVMSKDDFARLKLSMPDVARKLAPEMLPDHMCYGEIVSLGSGSINQPRIRGVAVGDRVLYALENIDHAYYDSETESGYQKMSQKALCARLEEDGQMRALTDWVITERDDVAMKRFVGNSIECTDEVLIDGQKTDNIRDGGMRLIVERVVSAGIGRRYSIRVLPEGDRGRLAYDDIRAHDRWVERFSVPQVVAGDAVGFSPSASVKFRRNGKWYRATPWDEMQFMPGVE